VNQMSRSLKYVFVKVIYAQSSMIALWVKTLID
jgi:hypothetical protein